ncbi:MAG: zinc ribbon domain-containing protein [Gammaproteobacteria bacterium]|nr:zinc ribbon domain-containing protein [Gammaproteobacteria bacterium]
MPIYEYECGECGHRLEALQKISELPLKDCPECQQPALEKLISPAAFHLKGTGWYATDFRDKGKGKDKKPETDAKSEESGKSEKAAKGNGSDKGASETGSSEKGSSDKGSSPKSDSAKSDSGSKTASAR